MDRPEDVNLDARAPAINFRQDSSLPTWTFPSTDLDSTPGRDSDPGPPDSRDIDASSFGKDFRSLPSPPPPDDYSARPEHGSTIDSHDSQVNRPNPDLAKHPHTSLFGGFEHLQPHHDEIPSASASAIPHSQGATARSASVSTQTASNIGSARQHSEDGEVGDDEDDQLSMAPVYPSEDGLTDEDADALRYEFRPAPRLRPLGSGGTWIDHDRSGNYDPFNENRPLPPRVIKRKRREVEDDEGIDDSLGHSVPAKRPSNYTSARQQGHQLIITLRLASNLGKDLLHQMPDNCPLGYEEYWNFLDDNIVKGSQPIPKQDKSEAGYRLRSRAAGTSTKLDQGVANDSCDISHNRKITIGHPAARGCKACYSLGQVCPMLEPDGTYPCYLCIEDECDCELLVEPTKKRSCECCKKQRIRCSYQDGHDHTGPCLACQVYGKRCVAGPAIDNARTRIGYDGKPATIREKEPNFKRAVPKNKEVKKDEPSGKGPYLTCVHCRRSGGRCGLRRADLKLPCTRCRLLELDCSLPSKNGAPARRRKPQNHHPDLNPVEQRMGPGSAIFDDDAAEHFKQLAFDVEAEQPKAPQFTLQTRPDHLSRLIPVAKPPAGKVDFVTTRLAHPVHFNAAKPDCHWCKDPFFPLFGIGDEVRVKVRFWPDGKGCTELARDAPIINLGSSLMCPDCTMDRVLILTCDGHKLQPLASRAVYKIDHALEALLNSKVGGGRKYAEQCFCSICPSLATHKCCTNAEGGSQGGGCGLRLCRVCAVFLTELFNNDLSKMVKNINGADVESFENGLRADYRFFADDSYLVKQVLTD